MFCNSCIKCFQYTFNRYNLHLAGLIEPFPGREPSLKFLHNLIGEIEKSPPAALFSEVQLARRPAQVLAEAARVPLYELDPIGGVEGRMKFADMLRFNVRVLSQATKAVGFVSPR